MLYVIIQTIQLLGRRILLKISYLSGFLVFSGIFQIVPILLVLPIVRVIARPGKQEQGLPKRMSRLLPEDLADSLNHLIATTETKVLIFVVLSVALVLFGIQALITRHTQRYLADFLDQQSRNLANKLFNNYLRADIFSYANPIQAIQSGCNALTSMLNMAVQSFYNAVMFFMISAILIFIYPLPGLASVIVIITATSLLAFVVQPKMDLIMQKITLGLSKQQQLLSDSMGAIKELKLTGREQFFFNFYQQEQRAKKSQGEIRAKFQSISAAINIVMRYVGLGVGLTIALYTLPKEDLAGFVMIFMILAMRVSKHAMQIISQSQGIYRSLLVLKRRYKTLLKYKDVSVVSDNTPIICKESIEFKDAYFRYENEEDEEDEEDEAIAIVQKEQEEEQEPSLPFVLENLNFEIKRGQFVGLVGRNGSGKSTILDILAGLNVVTEGSILIDGQELGLFDRRNWRKQITYVIQKPYMVSGSILYNVTLGLAEEEIDQELLERSLDLSMLNQVVEQLPKGIETRIGRHGTKVSGGQAQRIALARVLYQDRPILLLDEATRSIDAATEAEIMAKISMMRGQKTIIVVTHRVQSLRQCDNIYVLENKNIVASGDYETLCETSDLFRAFALGETKITRRQSVPSVA